MSNDSEESITSEPSESSDQGDSMEEIEVIGYVAEPYEDEPLTSDDGDSEEDEEEADADGLTPAVLESRLEGQITVREWCQWQQCSDQQLEGALEFRCCRKVLPALRKLTFDGSIEGLNCVTQRENFEALTNRTVLLQVAPLLWDKNGRGYRRRTGVTENEFVRSVAYRWVVRWMFRYMGWDNTRPLPACVYNSLRTKYSSHNVRGYATAQHRE
ncbi:uncharacterized protein [Montipora capricornis]|uniref:uncharacterized protein n=1 Tax=Montipora capricornis TaxID=246305 RepID=UPI0035F2154E